MFRSCKKCVHYDKDRVSMLRCMGMVRNICRAKNDQRIDNPFRSGIFCKEFVMRGGVNVKN